MKHLVVCLLLATSTLAPVVTRADAAPTAPPGPPPSKQGDKLWSTIVVQSIKPTLSARNVYVIKGMHRNGVRGGWTLETSYKISDATKVVQITLAAHAPAGSVTTRNLEAVEAKVELVELAGPAYSGKPGTYDVIVIDREGKELARTVYEIKPKP